MKYINKCLMELLKILKTKNSIVDIKSCYGCGVCFLKCPKKAIQMKYNKLGQKIPYIDKYKCINCGICKQVCPIFFEFREKEKKSAYVALTKDSKMLYNSSSGGISAALAKEWILKGGIVCGVSGIIPKSLEDEYRVEHIFINKLSDISKIQGSKYVQSNIIKILPKIKEKLKEGKKILFFGTSCQVAALKTYLVIDHENLITCDLICHGVIGDLMFSKYLKAVEKKEKNKLINVYFRTKKLVNPYTFTFIFRDSNNKYYKKLVDKNNSTYYRMFLGCIGYRKICYECKFASIYKPSDITLGDYYEIKEDYPELYVKNNLSIEKGISSVIVHTSKGRKIFEESKEIIKYKVDSNKIVNSHKQLKEPSRSKRGSILILLLYRGFGWKGVKVFYTVFDYIVKNIRKNIKKRGKNKCI